jgi:uncharacterized protein (DUF885 family)
MIRAIAVGILVVCALGGPAAPAGQSENERLRAFFDREWQWGLDQFPEGATSLGDNRYNDRLTDLSLAAIEARKRHTKEATAALKEFHRDRLAPENRLNYDLYLYDLEIAGDGDAFPTERMPIGPRSGVQIDFPSLPAQTAFHEAKDYEMYLTRLSAFPRQVEQVIALMKEGVRTGWVPAALSLSKVPAQLAAESTGDPEKSEFFEPFTRFPESIPGAERERLRKAGRGKIAGAAQPAYAKLDSYFRNEYLPACRKEVGASALPDGEAFYRYCVRAHTTTDLTPSAIHEIGVGEVARIRAEMESVIQETGFHGAFSEFLTHLRTDPKFYYSDAAALVTGYRDIAKRIDGELPRLFGKLPRNSYGVKVIPEPAQPAQTTAYYQQGASDGTRAGFMMVNTYKLDTRPKYEMEALTLHEAVPGHHLQISLGQELGDLPDFRRNAYYTAFGEGWGLYAESLGKELGLYKDPYSRFGQLTYEMWRACRLVVDTGMHAMHWDRQRAVDFMAENTAKTLNDINVEVDRYISWPGQALAYKIGELKIRELRARAEKSLGPKFDLRKFHDLVLGSGSLPLAILEKNVDRWIAEQAGK